MIDFEHCWNSEEADNFRAQHDGADGEMFRPVWDAARAQQQNADGAVGMEPLRKTNAAARGTPAADAPTTAAALSRASDLLSSVIGILMGQREKIAYTDNSPVAALVNEAVEFLRPWPEQLPSSAAAPVVLPAPDVFAKVSHKGAAKWDVEFTWPVGKFEEDGDHKLYTEQQVRGMLALSVWHHRNPNCITCNDHGAVGNILTAEPCPDCHHKLHVGESRFESWYAQECDKGWGTQKQLARDAYAAGMGDSSAQADALDADAQRDAERYRWLRDMNDWHSDPRIDDADGTKWQLTFYTSHSTEDQSDDNNLDSAIDAARAAQWGV